MARVVLFESRKEGRSALVPRRKSRIARVSGMKDGDQVALIFLKSIGDGDRCVVAENGEVEVPDDVQFVQARHVACSMKAAVTVDLID
jgi:hypothetical protein